MKDRHVLTLVERCKIITELDLSFTSITNDSMDSIATHLNSSLEKLDVSHTKIDSTALLELKSVRTLKWVSLWLRQPVEDLRFDLGILFYGFTRWSWTIPTLQKSPFVIRAPVARCAAVAVL